jgi:hypothetical protein
VSSFVPIQLIDAPYEQSIVFVHGLRGHRRDTWTKDNICWPQDLLSEEVSVFSPWIRCKHHQFERACILEHPVSALNQFSARIVAFEEKRCSESDVIINSSISQICVAQSPHRLCRTHTIFWAD